MPVAINDNHVTGRCVLRRLDWDSGHFGFPVAEVSARDLDDRDLTETLRRARHEGMRLVYWRTFQDRHVPEELLQTYSGIRVDRKATFIMDDLSRGPRPTANPGPVRISEHPKAEASPQLVALAHLAGEFSRFAVDSRVPRSRFESLYETWMRRSTLRDLADAVLVATTAGREEEPLGMVTISESQGLGQIGLLAVYGLARRHGVGTLLIAGAHQWMQERGATRGVIVSQLGNLAACRLYERSGYRLSELEDYYHFWPADGRP